MTDKEAEDLAKYLLDAKLLFMKTSRAKRLLEEDHRDKLVMVSREVERARQRVAEAEEVLKLMVEEGLSLIQAKMIVKK